MELKRLLGIIGGVAILLIIFTFVFTWTGFHRGEIDLYKKGGSSAAGSCSILFPVSAGTDEQIAKVLNDYMNKHAPANSPLKGKGLLIAKGARRSQVNPALIVAIASKETSFGTNGSGIDKDDSKSSHNSFGRTAAAGQPNVGRWYQWKSWDLSLYDPNSEKPEDESAFVKRGYTDAGQKTIGTFLNKYAPTSENNTNLYITQATEFMNEMARMGNGVVLGPECVEATLAWPLSSGTITSGFKIPSRPTHDGLDIAAPRGTPIMAAASGTVSFSGLDDTGCAYSVSIVHSNNLKTTYCHMVENSQTVKAGQTVSQGQVIGQVNDSGNSHGNHLHFIVRQDGKAVNPLNLLQPNSAIKYKSGWNQ